MIHFTQYADNKFLILEDHSFLVSRDAIIDVVENPDAVDDSKMPLYVAQKTTGEHTLKVVYKKTEGMLKIITFYPFRKKKP